MTALIKYLVILTTFLARSTAANDYYLPNCDKELEFKVPIQNQQEYKFYEDLKLENDDYNVVIDKRIRQFNDTLLFRTKECLKEKTVDLLEKHHINLYKFQKSPKIRPIPKSTKRLMKNEEQNHLSFNEINRRYFNNEDLNNYAFALTQQITSLYPMLDARYDIEGRTHEGLPIYSFSIGYKDKKNPVVLIDAGIHAREWHARNVALNILFQLGREAEFGVSGLLYNVSVIIIPNLNPDGYAYSYYRNKNWRKNRRPVENNCYGVDGNRNYDIEWSSGEQEKNPCGEIYKGPEPFSEAETKVVRDILMKFRDQCFLYISIHTFGNKILYPPGYSTEPHPRKKLLHRVAAAGAKAVYARTGTRFDAVQSGSGLYVAAGGSDDYAMDVLGIPFAFTFESGSEKHGFIVPESQLKKTTFEGWIGIKAMIKEAYYLRNR